MEISWLEPNDGDSPLTIEEMNRAGVYHEHLDLSPDNFQPALDRLKAERGYIEQDEVELKPDMPNLEAICAKFIPEHLHTDDEVRFVLEGEGVFDIRSADDRWMHIKVGQGDLLVVPANLNHRFYLTDAKHIRCVRLFKDAEGWVAHYRDEK